MARLRTIKPGFFLNDTLSQVPMAGRILFAGLWCIADRAGRLEDRPARIKAQVLPYDDCDVAGLLGTLAERGFVQRYSAGGCAYIQITNFERHQTPHVKETASTIPAPPAHPLNKEEAPDKHRASTVQVTALAPPVIGDLVVGSGDLNTPAPAGAGVRAAPPSTALVQRGIGPYSEDFEAFWKDWPRKIDKHAAWLEWERRIKEGVPPAELVASSGHLAQYVEREGTEERYIPHAATFLGRQRKYLGFVAGVPQSRAPPKNGHLPPNAPGARAARNRANLEKVFGKPGGPTDE